VNRVYPTAEQLGSLLSIPAARGPGGYGNGAAASDDDQITPAPDDEPPVDVGARSGQSDFQRPDFGQPDQEKDEAIARIKQQRDLTQAINANAFIYGRLIEARARYQNDPDFQTLSQRWNQDSGNIVIAGLNRIANDDLRQHIRDTLQPALAQETTAINDQAFHGAAADHAASRDQYLGNLVQNITLNPNDALLDGGITAYHLAIDNAVQHGYLTAEDALAEKRHAALELCAAHYSLLGRVDPARALDELQSGDNAHPLAQFLPDDTKDALIAQAQANQRADRLDGAEADRLDQQAVQSASDAAESAILKDRLGDNPTITAKTIANNRALTPDAKDRMLGLVHRADQPDPTAQSSAATAVDLLRRIRLPDGDDQKIDRMAPIVEA
jgi:hypothetical protein